MANTQFDNRALLYYKNIMSVHDLFVRTKIDNNLSGF